MNLMFFRFSSNLSQDTSMTEKSLSDNSRRILNIVETFMHRFINIIFQKSPLTQAMLMLIRIFAWKATQTDFPQITSPW